MCHDVSAVAESTDAIVSSCGIEANDARAKLPLGNTVGSATKLIPYILRILGKEASRHFLNVDPE